jgi:predicted signal transduction protein with EAL and GGDEF domain
VTFSGKGGKKFHVKVSLGVSQNKNKDKSIDDVIKRADDALYFAKMNGRDQIVVYEQQFGNKSSPHFIILPQSHKEDGCFQTVIAWQSHEIASSLHSSQ